MHGNDTSLTQLEANSEVIVDAEETLFEETVLTMASTFDKKHDHPSGTSTGSRIFHGYEMQVKPA
jgi:hypothetical protein